MTSFASPKRTRHPVELPRLGIKMATRRVGRWNRHNIGGLDTLSGSKPLLHTKIDKHRLYIILYHTVFLA
eukprot:Nitzschia sp. Nitz4//scaffold117_size69655//15936//16434//NITZ4_006017-RA/size69655-exonerate_est2genome-gene-0.18-mRNA-1//-1//CDS//3329533630//4792//frame0